MTRRNRRGRKNGFTLKTGAMAGTLALCTGGFGFAVMQSVGKAAPDKFGCFDEAPQRQTVVFFDASEPRFNAEQARSLQTEFKRLYDGLEFNERLSFITTEEDKITSVADARFHVCGAATSPQELEDINAESATAGYLKREKERRFKKILKPELDALLALRPKDERLQAWQSPVLESIQAISRLKDFGPGDRLVAVSDLIQNSESVRFCRVENDMPSHDVSMTQPYYRLIKPRPLDGVEVKVLMLQRYGYGQGDYKHCYGEAELMKWWEDYFNAHGVADPDFIRIRHGHIASLTTGTQTANTGALWSGSGKGGGWSWRTTRKTQTRIIHDDDPRPPEHMVSGRALSVPSDKDR